MNYRDFTLMMSEARAHVEQAEMLLSDAECGSDEAAYAEARDWLRTAEVGLETLRNTRVKDITYPAGPICLS